MKSPFKFLDAYTPEDRELFFGREQEVETLYQLVFKSKLLLVYGQSGTGKTSLIQCGLGGRFDLTDWFPFQVRRNDNINHSLQEALAGPAGGKLRNNSLTETIAWLYKNYLRPVYLIFDQFEELFILGKEEEQEQFIDSIKAILEAELPCKILLIMREEYIAQLYAFEQHIPSLFDRRLRVEPMNYANVGKVVTGSCQQFNITLEDPDRNIRQIIDNISGGKSGIQLPYLQVYLDRLWQEDYERTYGKQLKDKELEVEELTANNGVGNYPPLEFTMQEIAGLGDIEGVMEKFLQDQQSMIQDRMEESFQEVPSHATRTVLDVFVTEEGTKRPVNYERQEGKIQFEAKLHKQFADIPDSALQAILASLEQARILRFTETQVELAHDSLAELIDRERSTEQRQLNQVRRRISAAYVEQRETGVYLTARQLSSIEEYLPLLRLEPHLEQFVKDCYADAEAKEQEEDARIQRELQLAQDKLAAEQRARKRQRIFSGIIGLALIGALILGGVAWNQQQTMARQQEEIVQKGKDAESALTRFQQAEAEKVSLQVEDILVRARRLKDRGHTTPYRSMLRDAQQLLDEYQENPSQVLMDKKLEVEAMLKNN